MIKKEQGKAGGMSLPQYIFPRNVLVFGWGNSGNSVFALIDSSGQWLSMRPLQGNEFSQQLFEVSLGIFLSKNKPKHFQLHYDNNAKFEIFRARTIEMPEPVNAVYIIIIPQVLNMMQK